MFVSDKQPSKQKKTYEIHFWFPIDWETRPIVEVMMVVRVDAGVVVVAVVRAVRADGKSMPRVRCPSAAGGQQVDPSYLSDRRKYIFLFFFVYLSFGLFVSFFHWWTCCLLGTSTGTGTNECPQNLKSRLSKKNMSSLPMSSMFFNDPIHTLEAWYEKKKCAGQSDPIIPLDLNTAR
jgi:hypothetical protein